MDSMLEQFFASAVRYIQNHSGIDAAPYFDDIPENYIVPSLYFPVPRTSSKKVTFQTYLTTIYMETQFMASTDWLAQGVASNVRDCLILDDCCISIMNKDGTLTGGAFRISELDTRRVSDGIVQLTFQIRNYFSKEKDPANKANKINISGLIKPDPIYQAWYKATEEQRKDEEVQKECLQKVLESL